jgi:hypothetical protein
MAVSVPNNTTGSVVSEYAATQSTTTRQVQKVDGVMQAVFQGNLNYARTDYLVDADGKRIAIVQSDPMPGPMGMQPSNSGSIYLSPEALMADLAADPKLLESFNYIADYEDSKILADLNARKLV